MKAKYVAMCVHTTEEPLPVRVLDERFQNFGPSVRFDPVLYVMVGEGEK